MNEFPFIPLVDLNSQYAELKDQIDKAVSDCIADGNFIKGKIVTEFENAFSEYLGLKYCIGCGNGTDALELILKSLNIGTGDEVIVPALTWIATAEAVNNVGAEPVFVEISHDSYNIDVQKIEEKITKKTKAIIAVHLYGCPADMNEILIIAEKYKLYVVEDCAQAHGAEYYGKKVGSFGIASSFSFFPSKNLGAFGDAGAVVTNNEDLSNTVRRFSNHGQLQKRHAHSIIGRNSRLDSIQASILNVKLPYLDSWNSRRREAAGYYKSKLDGIKSLILPEEPHGRQHVYHLFVIRTKKRDELAEHLRRNGIASSVHYPAPLPFLDAYSYKQHKDKDFPVTLSVSKEVLSIPLFPYITRSQLDHICHAILDFY